MLLLGISAYYHDSAAVICQDDLIIAAAQEERFTRKKHDAGFPTNAVKFCLKQASVKLSEIDAIAFYDKPFLKFERLIETYVAEAPYGLRSFIASMPVWIKEKLYLKNMLLNNLCKFGDLPRMKIFEKLLFAEHHLSHAASAFYPSPFNEAAILTIDGVGEWTTTSIAHGKGNNISILKELKFPHSLGLLYSAFTYFAGFKVNSGEYKLMGLAPYGNPTYVDRIYEHLIDVKPDGSFRLNMKYFNYSTGLTMTSNRFNKLFGGQPRRPESDITQREMDLASSIQTVTEEIIGRIIKNLRTETGCENLCLAGGVALNCVNNGKLMREEVFKNIWIQPAAGDAGGALGAVYSAYYNEFKNHRCIDQNTGDKMQGTYLGPAFSLDEILATLNKYKASYTVYDDEEHLFEQLSDLLANGKVIGWHQGRMEFGPRALGARSIIGDARNAEMQRKMNLKIKYRESFRPFAPSVLFDHVQNYFEMAIESPYMLIVTDVKEELRENVNETDQQHLGISQINVKRSTIPAVTHVDYSARVQTVHPETNPRYYKLIKKFYDKTGYALIVNTSFNVRGEPIVCTPEDSYRCFMRTEMDVLVLENVLLFKENQPAFIDKGDWTKEFELD